MREARGGKLNDARWGSRMEGQGPYADAARALFERTCKKLGLAHGERRTAGDGNGGGDGDGDSDGDAQVEEPSTFARPPKAGDQLKLL